MWHVQIAVCVLLTWPSINNCTRYRKGMSPILDVVISPSYYAVITMVVDIVIVVETFIFSVLHWTVILFTLLFSERATFVHTQKKSFQQWIGLQTNNFFKYIISKKSFIWISSQIESSASPSSSLLLYLYLSSQINDFGFCDAKDTAIAAAAAAAAAVVATADLTSFHTIFGFHVYKSHQYGSYARACVLVPIHRFSF